MFGRIRSSQPGSHQLDLPRSTIVAGTRRQRTIVASTAIATASPTPNCFTVGSPFRMKLEKTATMISAADVMTRALDARPWTTAVRLSPVFFHTSLIRETRNT